MPNRMRRAELKLPADPRMLQVVRAAAVTLASDLAFTLDDLDDLCLGIDELVAASITGCDSSKTVELRLEARGNAFTVMGRVPGVGSPVTLPDLAADLLAVMTDVADLGVEDGDRTFRLRKKAAMASATAEERDAVVAELFQRYRETGDEVVRNAIVEQHQHLADGFARRFGARGIHVEDLRQTALVAMVRAVDRFDPDRGVSFATFASRTMEGELKRTLRDQAWSVRPPRSLQERHLAIRQQEEALLHQLGRTPTIKELADALDVEPSAVLSAMEAEHARRADSINAPGRDEAPGLDDVTDKADSGFTRVEDRLVLSELMDGLGDLEREILHLRFFDRLAQEEIAERVGVSQSYVSRLLRRALDDLRVAAGE